MKRCQLVWMVLMVMVSAWSCKVPERTTATSDTEKGAVETPRIIFLNYAISENISDREYTVTLINKIISNGKMKENANLPVVPKMDDLEYIVSDNNEKELLRSFIANPLDKTLEFVDDDGHLAKKDIRLDSALFSLRIQLDPDARFISIERYKGPDNANIHLHVVDITK